MVFHFARLKLDSHSRVVCDKTLSIKFPVVFARHAHSIQSLKIQTQSIAFLKLLIGLIEVQLYISIFEGKFRINRVIKFNYRK